MSLSQIDLEIEVLGSKYGSKKWGQKFSKTFFFAPIFLVAKNGAFWWQSFENFLEKVGPKIFKNIFCKRCSKIVLFNFLNFFENFWKFSLRVLTLRKWLRQKNGQKWFKFSKSQNLKSQGRSEISTCKLVELHAPKIRTHF